MFSGQSQLVTNQLTKAVPDFPMSRHRNSPSVCRIAVDVVSLAVAQKVTPSLDQFADEFLSFHTSSTSSFTCEPAGIGASSPSRINS